MRRVIASSPHCLQVLGDDYAKDLPISVVHHTTLLAQLVTDGRLSPRRELPLKVAYHDPCYLGRYAGEYDAPREVLRAIPSLELTEMSRIRESSLCCGGGGGGIWMDIPVTERFGALRVFEAQQVGAQVIATACPYCISMLEDAVKATDVEEAIAVRDVAELLAESVLPDSTPPSTSA